MEHFYTFLAGPQLDDLNKLNLRVTNGPNQQAPWFMERNMGGCCRKTEAAEGSDRAAPCVRVALFRVYSRFDDEPKASQPTPAVFAWNQTTGSSPPRTSYARRRAGLFLADGSVGLGRG